MTPPPAREDVRLEPVTLAHADAMYRWMCDPHVRHNFGLRTDPSPQKTRAWIERAMSSPEFRPFAICYGGTHVGNVVLDHIDPLRKLCRLSIFIGEPSARGVGVGQAAVRAALRVAFEELSLGKVYLIVHAGNAPAIAAYERVGFKREGLHRKEFLLDGRLVDEIYMGIFPDEVR